MEVLKDAAAIQNVDILIDSYLNIGGSEMEFLFRKKELIWINIDLPTKRFTIHHNCTYTDKMKETPFKGVGTLKRDGGWLKVGSISEADNLFENSYSHFAFVSHC
jgi:hypothetical protein